MSEKLKITEIHRPSSFEGALGTVLGIKDGMTLFHAPTGCWTMQSALELLDEPYVDVYSTLLYPGDLMQGTEGKLRSALTQIISQHPEAVFVVTSPSVEVIGDDIEGVVSKLGFKKCIVVRPPMGGLMHDGQEKAFLSLMSLMKPSPKKAERTVNVIGPTYLMYNWKADLFEVKRMLSNIGVSVNTVLTANSTVKEIEQAPNASLNIVMYPYDCGLETAKFMEKEFNIPYFSSRVPFGYSETYLWLEEIAKFFGINASNYLRKEVEDGFEMMRQFLVPGIGLETSVAISTDNINTYGVGISRLLKEDLGMDIRMVAVGTEDAAVKAREVCSNVLVSPTIDEKRREYEDKSPLVILGNWYDLKVSKELGFSNFVFADIPTLGRFQVENTPYMGFSGAKYLASLIVNQVWMNIFIESKGGLEDVLSAGVVPWEEDARRLMWEVAKMLPYFIRAVAVKKIEKECGKMAAQRKSNVTLEIAKTAIRQSVPDKRMILKLDEVLAKF